MKKKIYLWILPLLVIPIVRVYADTVSLNCPKEIEANSEFSCQLSGYTDKGVTSLDIKVITSGDIKYLGFTKDSYWGGDGENGRIALYGADILYNNFNIGIIKFKNTGGSNNNISLSNISFYDGNDEKVAVDDISLNVGIKEIYNSGGTTNNGSNNTGNDNSNKNSNNTSNDNSNKNDDKKDNTIIDNNKDNSNNIDKDNNDNKIDNQEEDITNIEINGYKIDFNKDIYEYTLSINDEDSLAIEPIINNDKITYTISGNEKLVNGSVIKITLLEDNNTKREYTIKIIKKEKANYKMIFIAIIGILVIVNIVRIILSRRKKND